MATFKEALQYAEQNPTSDFAKELETGIKSGQFIDVAKSEGVDLTPFVVEQVQPEQKGAGVATGIVKGLGSTVTGLAELGSKVLSPIEKGIDKLTGTQSKSMLPSQQELEQSRQEFKPIGTAEKIGFGAEQLAEFFIPGSKTAQIEKLFASKGVQSLPEITNLISKIPGLAKNAPSIAENLVKIGSRSAANVVGDTAVVAAQTGGDTKAMKDTAIISALFPVAGKTLSEVSNYVKSQGAEFAPRLINSLIKPVSKDMSYGKNPGRAISEEGITASTFDELATKVAERKNTVGQEIGGMVKQATEQGKVINMTSAVSPLDEAIAQANKSPKTNASLITRLENAKSDLLDGKDLTKMTPEEAFQFKQDVAAITKFTGNASDDALVNGALKKTYGKVKNGINTAVGDIKSPSGNSIEKLNEKYADLTTAEIAAKYRDIIAQRSNVVSLPANVLSIGTGIATLIGTGGAALPAVLAGLGGAGLEKALSSPMVKTTVAKWLAKSTPAEKEAVFKTYPALRGAVNKLFVQ